MKTPKEKIIAPGIELIEPAKFYCGVDYYYQTLLENENKTELDKLNLFLIQLGSKDEIGYRKKIMFIRKYLKSIGCNWTGL